MSAVVKQVSVQGADVVLDWTPVTTDVYGKPITSLNELGEACIAVVNEISPVVGFAWDIFNGSHQQIDYDIPFTLITKIEVMAQSKCNVHLQSGIVLELSGNQDTGEKTIGLLVFPKGEGDPEFVPWRQVKAIEFHQ